MAKNSIDEAKVKRYRTMFQRGLITDEQLQRMVEMGKLTEEEYQLIIAEPNN